MMPLTKTYRKLPIDIEAVQLNAANILAVYQWIATCASIRGNLVGIKVQSETRNRHTDRSLHGQTVLLLLTLEGEMSAYPGDWVIRGIDGEFYPCKDDIFRKTYEEVAP